MASHREVSASLNSSPFRPSEELHCEGERVEFDVLIAKTRSKENIMIPARGPQSKFSIGSWAAYPGNKKFGNASNWQLGLLIKAPKRR